MCMCPSMRPLPHLRMTYTCSVSHHHVAVFPLLIRVSTQYSVRPIESRYASKGLSLSLCNWRYMLEVCASCNELSKVTAHTCHARLSHPAVSSHASPVFHIQAAIAEMLFLGALRWADYNFYPQFSPSVCEGGGALHPVLKVTMCDSGIHLWSNPLRLSSGFIPIKYALLESRLSSEWQLCLVLAMKGRKTCA